MCIAITVDLWEEPNVWLMYTEDLRQQKLIWTNEIWRCAENQESSELEKRQPIQAVANSWMNHRSAEVE